MEKEEKDMEEMKEEEKLKKKERRGERTPHLINSISVTST